MTLLKTPEGRSYAPSFSADGSKVFFMSMGGTSSQREYALCQADVRDDTFHVLHVSKERLHRSLASSPDGRYLVFGSTGGTYLCDLMEKKVSRLHRNRGVREDRGHSFSRNGKKVAFISGAAGDSKLVLLDLRTGRHRVVFTSKLDLYWTAFLPGSTRLVCARRHGACDVKLWLLDTDASQAVEIDTDIPCGLRNRVDHRDVSLSSDGRRVFFVRSMMERGIRVKRSAPWS